MSLIVVDASVGIKWFVPEIHSQEARRWRQGNNDLHVPAFFFDLEIASVLWKKIRRGEITRHDADEILRQLPTLPLVRHPAESLLTEAFDLANQTLRTIYDCLYLALAIRVEGKMITADQRLFNSLSTTQFARFVGWIEDISAA